MPFIDPQRSWLMSRVRGKDTAPELRLRSALHRSGFRYRLHAKDLPGKPDIVFRSRKIAIFVHGCFWHRHKGCRKTTTPRTRRRFWQLKFDQNIARDQRNRRALRRLGWIVITIWECQTKNEERALQRIRRAIARRTPATKRSRSG